MSRWLVWVLLISGGIGLVLVATAMVGNRDDSGETVPAGQWAQSVCGSIGVWRGQMEAIVEDVRTPPANGSTGIEEPQSETPQGRADLVRGGLDRGIDATETLVKGIDNAGVPDTDQGEAAAEQISTWAASSVADLEQAQDSLDEEAPTLEEAITQFAGAVNALRLVLVSGVETLTDVAVLDPELGAAVSESSTCMELREARAST